MKLVVVESPAKAQTIERFLGSDYEVVASYGHIRDLPASASEIPESVRSKSWAHLGVNIENDFEPVYVIPRGSKKYVTALKKKLKDADELLLATDEDREGESISWHILEVLKPKIPVHRITFHEITPTAIKDALKNPREVNLQLVRAQESRRILDRLYGYSLSPVLWKKVRTKLSAGRVQSVAVRLIVEREEERQAFKESIYWDVEASLGNKDLTFKAILVEIDDQRLANGKDFDPDTGKLKKNSKALVIDEAKAQEIAEKAQKNVPWEVKSVEKKQTTQSPPPPFTTSTLQQAASSELGYPPNKTMLLAQRLYEGVELSGGSREGLITYMRTDSVTLSERALQEAGEFISKTFGKEYHKGPRRYKTKSKGAQEAHEAIRPTSFYRTLDQAGKFISSDELKLYRLIFNRATASQMADAILDKTTLDIQATIDKQAHIFRATGATIKFPGFLKIQQRNNKEVLLPEVTEGTTVGGKKDDIQIQELKPLEHKTNPPARYTEASLVKKLEEEGIGRPSTYAPTIMLIQKRDYVKKKNKALLPTYVGMAVVHLLRDHFDHYIDLKFTARMEQALDDIASGKIAWVDFLREFYHGKDTKQKGLIKDIDEALPDIDYPAIPVGEDPETGNNIVVRIGRNYVYIQRGEGGDGNQASLPVDLLIDELTPEKALDLFRTRQKTNEPLGEDPDTGLNIYALVGPYGPYLQLGEVEEGKKPKRVSLPKGKDITEVDLAYALKMLRLPRLVGEDPATGKEVKAGLGPYGPFVERGGTYKTIESEEKIFTITLDEALEKLNSKASSSVIKELGKHPETGDEVQIKTGRYGPYVTDGKVNASLSGKTDPSQLEMDEAVKLLEQAALKKKAGSGRGRGRGRGRTRTKTTAKKKK